MPTGRIAIFLGILALCSCIPRTVVPLHTVPYEQTPHKERLLIYLPGKGDSISVLQANGLIDSIRVYAPSFDIVAADANFGYYANRTLHERITDDLIKPAHIRGYRHIWFIGNSLGGFGSQMYASRHPGVIEGMILLGPYTTSNGPIREIVKAGGLASWSIPARVKDDDWERSLWRWHKECANGTPGCPEVYIAYGINDRFAPGIRLLEKTLPEGHVIALDGGHDWPVWKEGLMRLLRRGILK
jgi:pimeloyl-ACP methyl ester carboxylesterase